MDTNHYWMPTYVYEGCFKAGDIWYGVEYSAIGIVEGSVFCSVTYVELDLLMRSLRRAVGSEKILRVNEQERF